MVSLLLKSLVAIGCLLIVATPWVVVFEETRSKEPNGVAVIIAGLFCLFEIAAVIDWIVGALA